MAYPTLDSSDHSSYVEDTFLIMEQLPSPWAQCQARLPTGRNKMEVNIESMRFMNNY